MSEHATVTKEQKDKVVALAGKIKAAYDSATESNPDDRATVGLKRLHETWEGKLADLKVDESPVTDLFALAGELKTAVPTAEKLLAAVKPAAKVAVAVAAKPVIKYLNAKVEKACKDSGVQSKLKTILSKGPGYLGHKAVTAIKAQGHDHVGDDDAVAFDWDGIDLKVVAYGVKNDNAKPGNSGYKWTL